MAILNILPHWNVSRVRSSVSYYVELEGQKVAKRFIYLLANTLVLYGYPPPPVGGGNNQRIIKGLHVSALVCRAGRGGGLD